MQCRNQGGRKKKLKSGNNSWRLYCWKKHKGHNEKNKNRKISWTCDREMEVTMYSTEDAPRTVGLYPDNYIAK